MKLNTTLKVAAASVALALSASAHSITVTSANTGVNSWSELTVVAVDTSPLAGPRSYFRGLGVQLDNFLPNSNDLNNGAFSLPAFAAGTRTPDAGTVFTNTPIGGDSNWNAFLSGSSGAANVVWGVFGRRQGSATGNGQFPAVAVTGALGGLNNLGVANTGGQLGALQVSANAAGCDVSAGDSCVTTLSVNAALNTGATLTALAPLTAGLGFFLATKDVDNTNFSAATQSQYCNAVGSCAQWTINSQTGAVTYTLAALVITPPIDPPTGVIPLPAAGWLLLSGLAGLAGLSRRKARTA